MGHKKTDDKNNSCNHNFQLYSKSILWSVEEKKLTQCVLADEAEEVDYLGEAEGCFRWPSGLQSRLQASNFQVISGL